MKVLVATEKPFAPVAVKGIKDILDPVGYEMALLEKYTEKAQLLEAVAKHGLAPVGVEGEAFTPELHEAVGFDSRPDMEANAVARVLQSGYKLGDRLLRPAKVMINQ